MREALEKIIRERVAWLKHERANGGDHEHLTARIQEAQFLGDKIMAALAAYRAAPPVPGDAAGMLKKARPFVVDAYDEAVHFGATERQAELDELIVSIDTALENAAVPPDTEKNKPDADQT